MPPFFSVIVPVYNRATIIEAALGSVLAQTMADYEVIVVDDGSTDDTVGAATEFAKRFSQPVKILQQPNRGPGAARNTGIAGATGQYVALLDSDDLWFPWTLAIFHQAISQFRPAFLCGVPINIRPGQTPDTDGTVPMSVEQHADFFSVPGVPFHRFTTSGVAILRSSLSKVGGFAGERINYEDLDLWMRLGAEPGFVLITAPPAVVRRFLGDNLSESRPHNLRGATFMITSEKKGLYPGGTPRRAQRRQQLTNLMRNVSVAMVRTRDRAAAVSIYFQIFFWSVRQRRFRYLLGFPLQLLLGGSGKT